MGSAATANPFQLLIDDENEDPMLMAAAAPQKAPKASPAVAAAPTKPDKSNAPANSVSTDARGEFGRGRGRDSRGGRGGRDGARGGARGDRPDRFDRAPRVQESNDDGFETAGSPGNREGGRGGARLGGRGGRGGRGRGELGASGGSDRPPRREYERRDGTGRGHEVVKRGGAGRGNWGTEGEGAEGAEAPVDAEIVEGGSPGDSDAPVQQETVPEEPEEKTMTLEEYEKISAEKRAGLNKTASNQNAVDLQVQFKGMATISKSNIEEDAAFDLSRAKGTGVRKEKEKKVKDVVTDVGFSVEKVEERSGGFRGGRGEGRGGRGRGGDRGDRGDRGEGRGGRGRGGEGRGARGGRGGEGREPAPSLNVEDTSAFPTL